MLEVNSQRNTVCRFCDNLNQRTDLTNSGVHKDDTGCIIIIMITSGIVNNAHLPFKVSWEA